MASTDEKLSCDKNGITKAIETSLLQWADHITTIDLSNKNLNFIEETTKFPPNLYDLNLSHNRLSEVPSVVLKLKKVKHLDLSYNSIIYFDNMPSFCHTIETLNLSCNHLAGPPYWVWADGPKNLVDLNLNYNLDMTKSINSIYLDELLKYTINVESIKISNCYIHNHLELFSTFCKAKSLEVGVSSLSNFRNRLIEIPCVGLDKCCDIERLNLSNTQIYNVRTNIDMFTHLVEIDLSLNNIGDLPVEFCNLENLEICILSSNNLLYLPEDIHKLKKLVRLHVDNNELCMLPESIKELDRLELVDFYNNCLYEVPDEIRNVRELDLAQNYFDEPEDDEYVEKKSKFRMNIMERYDGRRMEKIKPDNEHSCTSDDDYDDEEYMKSIENANSKASQPYDPPSSPEDWDSDDYWVPFFERPICPPKSQSPWMYYVKKKMADGNFCPMDAHMIPIADLVRYQNQCNPKVWVEVEGQFDDYSDDNS